MSTIAFKYNDKEIYVQCLINEKMKDIFHKFCIKAGIDDTYVIYYLYNGNRINEDLTFNEIANDTDKKRSEMEIIVQDMHKGGCSCPGCIRTIKKSKHIICPACGESAQIKIKNYKISLSECIYNHKVDDLNINEFKSSQLIDESKIICDECKNTNKAEIYNNMMYFCNTCKLNLCPICKFKHDKTHYTINYDDKYFICDMHRGLYNSYCKTCNKNICCECESYHYKHELIELKKLFIKKEDIESKLKKIRLSIDKFKEDINAIENILHNVIDYCEDFYKFIEEIIRNFDFERINYQNLCNLKEIYNEELSTKLDNIINSKNYTKKITNIFNIYNSINNNQLIIDEQSGNTEITTNENIANIEKRNEKEKELIEEISGEQLMTVIFTSEDENVHHSFFCKNTDKLKDLEFKLYEIYPEYSKTDNSFLCNGRKIIKSKDLEYNQIKNSDIITLYSGAN